MAIVHAILLLPILIIPVCVLHLSRSRVLSVRARMEITLLVRVNVVSAM
jgi:hypothetical protein